MRSFKKSYKVQDYYYTPSILINPILKYLKPNSIIWCPFDTEDSLYVKILRENGFKVIATHIDIDNGDFFELDIDCDYIISNPPFSDKIDIFKKLFELNKPFMMLMNIMVLNYQVIGDLFYEAQEYYNKDIQLLIFDKKVSFNGNTSSFNSSYICYNVLPKQIIWEHLKDNNSGKFYRGEFNYDND